jgi:hypothetical protein
MKTGLTEIIILHDNNVPIKDFEEETRKYGKDFFAALKKAEAEIPDGEIRITLGVFGEEFKMLANDIPVAAVRPAAKQFTPGNGTRNVLDSLGNTIIEKGKAYSNTDESEHPENIIVILTAFGRDNASKNYTYNQIADMIAHQSYVYKWRFICMTNEPTIPEQLGIPEEDTIWIDSDDEDFWGMALEKLTGRLVYSLLHI